MEDIFILGRKDMAIEHIFNKETDSRKLAMEIVEFLRKWGMWKDVQIFTGGKCYTDGKNGELKIRDEVHPEKYTTGLLAYEDCNGEALYVEKDFSNPERLLDMTFEGPLYLLLRHHEYEVSVEDVSEEAKHIILPEKYMDEVEDLVDEFMTADLEHKTSWDPAEYDSYEEWLELNQYCDMDELSVEGDMKENNIDFSSKDEYEDFLLKSVSAKESMIREYFMDDLYDGEEEFEEELFFDGGRIANQIFHEFDELLEKYGLWYELCFSWGLTTYRIGEFSLQNYCII